jgi:hypothetical protein
MHTITHEESVLEQFGPRDVNWRRASDKCLSEAQQLAYMGRHKEALYLAQDEWIGAHGDLHGIRFRVRSVTTAIHGLNPIAELE